MSDARVTFETLGYTAAEAGAEERFSFKCPKADRRCKGLLIRGRTNLKHDPQGLSGGVPQWNWDGDRVRPTFTPSINCVSCWHGYIRGGRCVDTSGKDEP